MYCLPILFAARLDGYFAKSALVFFPQIPMVYLSLKTIFSPTPTIYH